MKAYSIPAPTMSTPPLPLSYNIEQVASALYHQGYAHVDGLLEETLLTLLHKQLIAMDAQDELDQAGIGRGQDYTLESTIRRDHTKWIDGSTLAECLLLERFETLRIELNKTLMLGLFDVESHFAVYHPGSFYARHSDSFQGAKNRLLSLVIYLNPHWEAKQGGTLNLYPNEHERQPMASILPEYGHAVFFLSEEIPHEVTISLRTRYSIAAWYRCHQPL